MKYSLCFFSQAEMYRYNCEHPGLELNLEDTFLLLEVRDMIVRASEVDINSKPATSIRHIDTEDGVRYFNLEYDKLADDLFIANWKPRTVGDRMSKYVKGGLLKKITKPKGEGGIATFFAATTALNDLLYDKNNPEHRVDPRNNEEITVSEEKDAAVDEQEESRMQSQRTSEAIRTTEKRASEAVRTTEKRASEKSILYNNPSTNKNPPTSHLINDSVQESASRLAFNSMINKKFGFEPRFQPDLWDSIHIPFQNKGIGMEYAIEYGEWLYEYLQTKCKNPNSFSGLFGIAWTKEYNIDRWWNQTQTIIQREKAETLVREQNQVTCPICGCKYDRNEDACPNCKTEKSMMEGELNLQIAKDVWTLRQQDPQKADAYNSECFSICSEFLVTNGFHQSKTEKSEMENALKNSLLEARNKYFSILTS